MTESTLTIRELFEAPQDISARLEPALDTQATVESARQEISNAARAIRWSWVRSSIAERSRELLDLNVLDVLVASWKKYLDIAQYADRDKYPPSETILAPLYEHTVESVHKPYIQVLFKGKEVGRAEFNLEFSLTIEAFALKIKNAKIREIQAGSAKGKGSLTFAGVSLWEEETKPLRFPGHIPLGSGIPLIDVGLHAAD